MESLNPRIRTVWILKSTALAGVLGAAAGALAVLLLEGAYPWVATGVFAALVLLFVVYQRARYDAWRFDLRDDSVYLERGVFVHVRTLAPFVRIQHVDTRRSPIDRLFGLASVVVYTAGSRGADASIPGLLPDRAEQLRETLKDLAVQGRSREDAV